MIQDFSSGTSPFGSSLSTIRKIKCVILVTVSGSSWLSQPVFKTKLSPGRRTGELSAMYSAITPCLTTMGRSYLLLTVSSSHNYLWRKMQCPCWKLSGVLLCTYFTIIYVVTIFTFSVLYLVDVMSLPKSSVWPLLTTSMPACFPLPLVLDSSMASC